MPYYLADTNFSHLLTISAHNILESDETMSQNRDYNRSPTSVGTFDVNGAAHVASRILAAILLASKNGEFDRVLLGSSLQKLDYQ